MGMVKNYSKNDFKTLHTLNSSLNSSLAFTIYSVFFNGTFTTHDVLNENKLMQTVGA
jgi:hypothetical protein